MDSSSRPLIWAHPVTPGRSASTPAAARRDQVVLVEQRRPGPTRLMSTDQHAPQLRQLVETGAQRGPDRRQPMVGIVQQVGGDLGRVDPHGAELRHRKQP
jgi:hypothetical protein